MELIIATANTHKFRELRSLLQKLKRFDLYSLRDFPHYQVPQETGSTFEENAALKACHAATHLNKWCLADDSGLVVPALNGAPGVFSSCYAGPDATDRDNRLKLLKEMRAFEEEKRAAFFECCLVLSSPTGTTHVFKGICEGMIKEEERGEMDSDTILFLKNMAIIKHLVNWMKRLKTQFLTGPKPLKNYGLL